MARPPDLRFTLRTRDDHEILRDHRGSNLKTLLEGMRERLLQIRRSNVVEQIRGPAQRGPLESPFR